METQETPAQHEHKPGQKIAAKKLWDTVKNSAQKGYQFLGTGGLIALILGLILLTVIISYERRFDRLEYGRGYYPTYRVHTIMPRMFDESWIDDIERSWARMDKQFREMERRHERLLQDIEKTPKVVSDGQYTGYKTVNGQTLQYVLNISGENITGTLLGTDTEALNRLRTELEKAGITITNTNGNIQFTAPKEKLETIVQIVNK